MDIILASKSPRRREMLAMLTDRFSVICSDADENVGELPLRERCSETARRKCLSVFESNPLCCVIGCDTLVEIGGRTLGKPHSVDEARGMITLLAGDTHKVCTGVYIAAGEERRSFTCETLVTFFPMTCEEIERYISTDEPYDKAGGYGIQGYMGRFVDRIDGDYFSAMGFPLSRIYSSLRELSVL